MSGAQDKKAACAKRKYVKPRLRTVELVAEEVLGVGCKDAGGMATLADDPPCTLSNCDALGS